MAADYANAAPPVHGVNFQPPVPDNRYGPMLHTYVPRHDGVPYYGHQVGLTPLPHAQVPCFAAPAYAGAVQPQSPWYYRYYAPPTGYNYYYAS